MKRNAIIAALTLVIALAALAGCSSKKEKAAETPSAPNAAQPGTPGKSAVVASSPQDEAEALGVGPGSGSKKQHQQNAHRHHQRFCEKARQRATVQIQTPRFAEQPGTYALYRVVEKQERHRERYDQAADALLRRERRHPMIDAE